MNTQARVKAGPHKNKKKQLSKSKSSTQAQQPAQKQGEEYYHTPGGIQKLISHILDGGLNQKQKQKDPEDIRVKDNVLTILLVVSAYGVYHLIGDFLDVLLIAYFAGISYYHSQESFTSFVTDPSSYESRPRSLKKRVAGAAVWVGVGFVFPRLRYLLTHPHKVTSWPTFRDYLQSVQKTHGYVVITCEILIGCYILYLLLGPELKKLGQRVRPTNVGCVRVLFALMTLLVLMVLVVTVPSVLVRQLSSIGHLIEDKVEENIGCELISFKDSDNESLPLCSDKFTSENAFIRETLREFREQNKTLEECLVVLEQFREDYLSEFLEKYPSVQSNIYYYEEVVCTWYSFIEKAISYSGLKIDAGAQDLQSVFLTGTNIFKLLFGNLASVIAFASNSVFNLSTFVTTFLLTIKYYSHSSSHTVKQIFSAHKQELIGSITNLVRATIFIVLEHFILSVLLLEIFGVTPVNLMVASILASMALFPFVRPWFGVLVVSLIRMLLLEEYYVSVSFILLYYYLSEKIYSVHYRRMELHEIITNMSVLFGIYRFGVAGIFYGPLIIVTYQCVQRELFRKYDQAAGQGK